MNDNVANKESNLDINYSRIITYAVCVDNKDPMRAGRIRAIKVKGQGITDSQINDPLKAIKKLDSQASSTGSYKPWTKGEEGKQNDPYLFASFLPLHLNVIPRPGEAVKIITYETVKDSLNQEYIGPMISQPGEIRGDNYSSGDENTSFGNNNISAPAYAPNGLPLEDQFGCFPNPDDIAIYGRENCDILLGMREKAYERKTKDKIEEWYPQILLRSGKLIPNNTFTSKPQWNDKPTFIQLSTFPETLTIEEKTETKSVPKDDILRTLIEYHLDPTTLSGNSISGYVNLLKLPYKTTNVGPPTSVSTPPAIKMAGEFNLQETITQSTFVARLNFTGVPTLNKVSQIINNFILQVDKGKWNKFIKPIEYCTKTYNPEVDLNNKDNVGSFLQMSHPMYFRPTLMTQRMMDEAEPSVGASTSWSLNKTNSNIIKEKIELEGVLTKGHGLAFTENSGKRKVPVVDETSVESIETLSPGQQGLVGVGGEKIYLLSYNSSELNGPIALSSNYGMSQKEMVSGLMDKTNSMVRGEKLLELLEKMVSFMNNHCHAFPGLAPVPQGHDGTRKEDIAKLMNDAKKNVLNSNIRIN